MAKINFTPDALEDMKEIKAYMMDFISVPVSTIPAWKVSMNS